MPGFHAFAVLGLMALPWAENRIVHTAGEISDEYLRSVADCGMNGVWTRVWFRELDEAKRAELRRTAQRCARHGVRLWAMSNEPRRFVKGDPFLAEHAASAGAFFPTHGSTMWCPSRQETLDYVERETRRLFEAVPELGGFLNIAYGENLTTCLDAVECCDLEKYWATPCERCARRPYAAGFRDMSAAFVRGIRAAGSDARYLAWFYQPMATPQRAPWVAECAAAAPEGATFVFNFESGIVSNQLGRARCGGDYWLSQPGPGAPFAAVAAAARASGARLGAKIQTCNSHELATLPYVPAPGLLYRKYRALHAAGVKDVVQSWYFGSDPSVMLKAAGMLSREDFTDGEAAFLKRLAASEWGEDGAAVARLWLAYGEAFSDYPLSNAMQYYGPFHAGIAWPLCARAEAVGLPRTWYRDEPPAGDFVGECLRDFTLDEAEALTRRMAARCRVVDERGEDVLAALERRYAHDAAKRRDLGVMRAFRLQMESAHAIFRFYLLRRTATRAAADEMRRLVQAEALRTRQMLALAREDPRLGFHAEAKVRHYDPAILERRLASLAATDKDLGLIGAELAAGRPWPVSERVRALPCVWVDGEPVETPELRFRVVSAGKGVVIRGTCDASVPGVAVTTADLLGTGFPERRFVGRQGAGRWTFELEYAVTPDLLEIFADTEPTTSALRSLWPFRDASVRRRGGLDRIDCALFGRIENARR